MGTLASGSIDLKSLKVAGDEVNKYITTIDSNNGIQVHAENNVSSNYTQIDSNGMEVYQNSTSVAQFGATTRVGEEDKASITIDSTSIAGAGEGGKKFFNFTNSGVSISSTIIRSTNIAMKDYPTTQSGAITTAIDFDPSSITVRWRSPAASYQQSLGTFTFGTSATKTKSFTYNSVSFTLSINYDGARTFKSWINISSNLTDKIRIWYELGKTTLAPSYEIGSGEATGGYALAEGRDTTASGNYSHAEGCDTTASSIGTHSEGRQTTASGNYSHAEGYATTAGPGAYSHAEGYATTASGGSSHASGEGTIANRACQYVIGSYNVEDTQGEYPADKGDYIFIIGNGDVTAPSNALTVDWNGNVDIASGAKYKINGTALAASDVGAVPTTRIVNGKALSANIADADYVTSTGAESGFYWRKWNSETVEAWGIKSFNATAGTAWGNMYYYDFSITIPSGIFSAAPLRGIASCNNLQWIVAGVSIISATSVKVRLVKPVSSSQAGGVYIYLYG